MENTVEGSLKTHLSHVYASSEDKSVNSIYHSQRQGAVNVVQFVDFDRQTGIFCKIDKRVADLH